MEMAARLVSSSFFFKEMTGNIRGCLAPPNSPSVWKNQEAMWPPIPCRLVGQGSFAIGWLMQWGRNWVSTLSAADVGEKGRRCSLLNEDTLNPSTLIPRNKIRKLWRHRVLSRQEKMMEICSTWKLSQDEQATNRNAGKTFHPRKTWHKPWAVLFHGRAESSMGAWSLA